MCRCSFYGMTSAMSQRFSRCQPSLFTQIFQSFLKAFTGNGIHAVELGSIALGRIMMTSGVDAAVAKRLLVFGEFCDLRGSWIHKLRSRLFVAVALVFCLGMVRAHAQAGFFAREIASGLSTPRGVAVDSNGNVYVAANGALIRETYSNGSYSGSSIGSGLGAAGVAVDNSGNVYVTDYSGNAVYEETYSGGSYTQTEIISGVS